MRDEKELMGIGIDQCGQVLNCMKMIINNFLVDSVVQYVQIVNMNF